ncbi:Uncharacterised protein [Bordetella pertussis]|nr:Uncharacterised protein [Bordetella pertussis]
MDPDWIAAPDLLRKPTNVGRSAACSPSRPSSALPTKAPSFFTSPPSPRSAAVVRPSSSGPAGCPFSIRSAPMASVP